MAVLVKTDESHSISAEIQLQQSAENGTEKMTHTVRGIKQENTTPSRALHEGQSDSTMNPLPTSSSPEAASMVCL